MNLGNNPGKIKQIVSSGVDGVRLHAPGCTLEELEQALEYAESQPLTHVSKSTRKQLRVYICRAKKQAAAQAETEFFNRLENTLVPVTMGPQTSEAIRKHYQEKP